MGTLRNTPAELRLLELANRQFGVVRYEQLIALGLTQNAVHKRREACRLTRIHDGVFAFGHTELRDEGVRLAALWACGDGDSLSHFAAGAYHGWRLTPPDDRIHVSTTGTTTSRGKLVVHRVKTLDGKDVFTSGPFRVTTVPRTLVDLADVMGWPEYRALADGLPSLRVNWIRSAQGRAPGRSGRGKVTRLIAADDAHTKSEFERLFLRFLIAHRIAAPSGINVRVAGHKADCHYARERLVVELDGRAFHRRRSQMRADRQRDSDYQLAGQRILRLVWDDLNPDEAATTATRLRGLLALGAA